MTLLTHLATTVAGLVLLLTITPSWSEPVCVGPGCNPTVSDRLRNTAGGSGALVNVIVTPEPAAENGFDNTAFGFNALSLTTIGPNNTAIGSSALGSNTIGDANTATGAGALIRNTTGSANTATGVAALQQNNGDDNTAIGIIALRDNVTGNANTAAGARALQLNISGSSNTAIGSGALTSNSTGGENTASGAGALHLNDNGRENTASGANALSSNISRVRNTAVGHEGLSQSTGNKNIGIGFKAGVALTVGNNNIYLGSLGGDSVEYQTMRLGRAQTRTFIAGVATASVDGAPVMIDTTTGQLGIATSSARFKQDVAPMGTRSEKVLDLRPVTFVYKDDAHAVMHYGLIAEVVARVYPELVISTSAGEAQTVKYLELIPMLLNELQRQRQTLDRQERELAALRALVGGASSR
jgi:post-segregation antitoxin (ccd killing protein)